MSAWERPCLDRRIGPREPLRRAGAAAFVLRRYQSLLIRARGERPPEGAWASDHPRLRPTRAAAPERRRALLSQSPRPVGPPTSGWPLNRAAAVRFAQARISAAAMRRVPTRRGEWDAGHTLDHQPRPKRGLRPSAAPGLAPLRRCPRLSRRGQGAGCPAGSLTAQPPRLGAQTVAPEEADPHARAGGCGPISSQSGGASSPDALSPQVLAWGRAWPGPGRPAGRAPGDGTTPAGPSARTSAPGSVPIPGHGVCRRAGSLPTRQRAVETDGCGRHAT